MSLEKKSGGQYWRTIVPLHREIRPGTLSDILNQTGLSQEDLARLLRASQCAGSLRRPRPRVTYYGA